MHYFVYIITIDSLVYQNDYFVLIVSDYRLVLISISSVTILSYLIFSQLKPHEWNWLFNQILLYK